MIDLLSVIWILSPLFMLFSYNRPCLSPLFYVFSYFSISIIFVLLFDKYFIYPLLVVLYIHLDCGNDY